MRVGGLLLTLIAVLLPTLAGTPHLTMSTSTRKDYLPVVLQLSPAPPGVRVGKLTYPPSQDWYFEPLKEHVPVYQAPFRLTQDITIASTAKAGQTLTVQGVFKYQACDDTICYNPVNAPVSWTLMIR